jgi:signal transduction histidine kinase
VTNTGWRGQSHTAIQCRVHARDRSTTPPPARNDRGGVILGPGAEEIRDSIASVGLHDCESEIVSAAADAIADVADVAMAAVHDGHGRYPMAELRGTRHPGWMDVSVSDGVGLGGRVLAQSAPFAVEDYLTHPVAAWRGFAESDRLHGGACVPVFGPDGIQVLLYSSTHEVAPPGGVAIAELERVAGAASVGLHHVAARTRERELAVLRERQRLAITLHDSVAQMLFAIGVAAERSRQERDPDIVAGLLEEIQATAALGRRELRETLARLNSVPEGLAFEALFEAELRLFERESGSQVWLTRRGEPRQISRPAEELLIDALREGAQNAIKHGGRGLTLVNLCYERDSVVLSLQRELAGDMAGAAKQVTVEPGAGLGVLSARAERLHGGLDLSVDSDHIAVLRLELPARASLELS